MLAIIPARGGSKGLPGKNIKLLNGKPLIAYTILAAMNSKSVSRIVVSTDCAEIADHAKQLGAEVPFMRPSELAQDGSLAIDNYNYCVDALEQQEGNQIIDFCVLQPTSPLRNAKDIDGAISLFREKQADSVISYCREAHPVHWHKYLNDDCSVSNVFDTGEDKNRQDYRETVYPNGAIYVFRTDLIKRRTYYSEKTYAFLMPRERSVDIDDLQDFMLAKFYLDHTPS